MVKITRIGVSMEPELLSDLDRLVKSRGYPSRSEAIRDLVRERLNADAIRNPDERAIGSIAILYSHHDRGLSEKITEFQHRHHDIIISTTHIHLDEERCLELLVCRGPAGKIRELSDGIGAIKGVRHGGLSLASIGRRK